LHALGVTRFNGRRGGTVALLDHPLPQEILERGKEEKLPRLRRGRKKAVHTDGSKNRCIDAGGSKKEISECSMKFCFGGGKTRWAKLSISRVQGGSASWAPLRAEEQTIGSRDQMEGRGSCNQITAPEGTEASINPAGGGVGVQKRGIANQKQRLKKTPGRWEGTPGQYV